MSSLSSKDRVSLCSFTFSDGRRCRTPRINNHPHFCFYHAQKEARARAAQKLGKDLDYFFSGDYLSACDLSTALGRLIPAVLRGEIKPKTASTLAYLVQTLMQAIQVSQHEYCEAFSSDAWRRTIRNSVKGNHNYLFPPAPTPEPPPDQAPQVVAGRNLSRPGRETGGGQAPQPAPAPQPVPTPAPTDAGHPERSEGSRLDSAAPATDETHPVLATPTAPSPHTSLPPTSAEFVQQVVAGLQTGGGQAPQPAQATKPVPAQSRSPIPTQATPTLDLASSPPSSRAPQTPTAHTAFPRLSSWAQRRVSPSPRNPIHPFGCSCRSTQQPTADRFSDPKTRAAPELPSTPLRPQLPPSHRRQTRLESTVTRSPVTVDSKPLTTQLSPLSATLTKNQGANCANDWKPTTVPWDIQNQRLSFSE